MNVSLSGGVVIDSHLGFAVEGRVGKGTSISAGDIGVGAQVQITGKEYVEQLQEVSRESGASTDLPNIFIGRVGVQGGVDIITSGQDLGMNLNAGLGAGLGPGELHTNTGETHMTVFHSSMPSEPSLPIAPKSPMTITTPEPSAPVIFRPPTPAGEYWTTPEPSMMWPNPAPTVIQLSQNYIDPQTGGINPDAW